MEKIGEIFYFFGWRATLGLLNRCFGVLEPRAEMPRVVWEVLIRLYNRSAWYIIGVETKEV